MRSIDRNVACALVIGVLGITACAPANTAVNVDPRVAVTITPRPDELPFNPKSALITSAARQLAELARHPIVLDVDAAMVVPEFRRIIEERDFGFDREKKPGIEVRVSFEEALGQSFENIINDLQWLQRESPAAFTYAVPLFERVSLRYDATLSKDVSALDADSRTLVIRGPARRNVLVRPEAILWGVLDASCNHFKEIFRTATPDSIAPALRRDYFAFRTGEMRNMLWRHCRDEAKADSGLAESPQASRIIAMLRLAEISTADAGLSQSLKEWLHGQRSWFVRTYTTNAAAVSALPAQCTFKKAEAAYTRWLMNAFGKADNHTRDAIERAVFVRSPSAWPGIDRFAFGLRMIDEHRASGHGLHDADKDFFRFAFESDGGVQRLGAAMVERNDRALTDAVFASISPDATKDPRAKMLALLRAVELRPPVWLVGMHLFAETMDTKPDAMLLEEAKRLWLQYPDYRGVVLYMLARTYRNDSDNIDWIGFERTFTTLASERDLTNYLSQGSRAMALLSIIWPALAKGYSRAAIIIPKLDAFLDDKTARELSQGALVRIIRQMCDEKNKSDLDALRRYLKDREARTPGQSYAKLIDETCPSPSPLPPPSLHNEVRLVPGTKNAQ
ncbi:MAG: hypothetical protein FWD69_17745 [Polyangiaceae bacterium]|nr:hypothetical protein [Polyangiaceae bacterium]